MAGVSEGQVAVEVLGPLAVSVDGVPARLSRLQRQVVAMLAVEPGRVVSVARLADELWGDGQPVDSRNRVQALVSSLRKILGDAAVITQPPGYRLDAKCDHVLFENEAATASTAGELAVALGRWKGNAFDGLTGPHLTAAASRLQDLRLHVTERLMSLRLAAGEDAALVPELTSLVAENPFHEELCGHLMLALYRSGRAGVALEVFHGMRQRLSDSLGVAPGARLQLRFEAILRGAPELDLVQADRMLVPRELPPATTAFCGRAAELAVLDRLLAGDTRAAVAIIAGSAGVGKTALAVQWSHSAAPDFPDGQLYLNLRGHHRSDPMSPGEALGRLLRSLDVPPEAIPHDADAAERVLRSRLAGHRVLVLLDNAGTAEQVRPLLPASAGSLVIVTSRHHLTGLIARDGAWLIGLETLKPNESMELLRQLLGSARIDSDLTSATALAARCGHLPLALRVAAASLTVRPRLGIADFVRELTTIGTLSTLDLVQDPDSSVRTVFAQSYQHLDPAARRLFRLFGLLPIGDATLYALASLSGWSMDETRRHTATLTGASLLMEQGMSRYTMHDLLKEYAAELAHLEDPPEDCQDATLRLLSHYTHTAHAAMRILHQAIEQIAVSEPADGVLVHVHAESQEEARRWFNAERSALLAAVDHAEREGFDLQAWQLAAVIATHLDWTGHWGEFVTSQHAAARAAQHLGDVSLEARCHRGLGRVYPKLGQDSAAQTHLEQALVLYEALGDRIAMAHTHINISMALERRGLHARALPHAITASELYREEDDKNRLAYAFNNIGWHQAHLGNYDEALHSCEQALYLHQSADNTAGEASTLDSLAFIHHRRGDHTKAAEAYELAVARLRQIGNRLLEGEAFDCLGDVHLASGSIAKARTAWQSALEILTELGQDRANLVRDKLAALP